MGKSSFPLQLRIIRKSAFLMQLPSSYICCCVVVCSALSCYQCSSENDPECMEDFDTGNDQRFLESTKCDVNAARFCVKTTGIFGGK